MAVKKITEVDFIVGSQMPEELPNSFLEYEGKFYRITLNDLCEIIKNNMLSDIGVYSEEDREDTLFFTDLSGNIICKIDKDGVHSVAFNGAIAGSSSSTPYTNKTLISIGDSLSAHDKWQKWLVSWLGCNFDLDKNINGFNSYPPMAKGGTAVFPNSTDSIYIRSLSAKYYDPDIIVVYAGQNDVPHFGSSTSINTSALGTIDDIPYRKTVPYTSLAESEYTDYTSWYEGRPTLYSYCMGLIENLLESCPKSKIIIVEPMKMWTSDGEQSVGRNKLVEVWTDIAKKYSLPYVDLWNESGVNSFNAQEYYPNEGNVHPNDYGYNRIAQCIYAKL